MKPCLWLLFLLVISIQANAQWVKLDELSGANIGAITELNGNLYVSTANIIYKSEDLGQSWVEVMNGIPPLADINALAATSNALYAGANDGGFGDKVFVSTDGGDTWTPTGGLGAFVLAFDFASIQDTLFVVSNFGVLYRSSDQGATFEDLGGVGIGAHAQSIGSTLYMLGQGSVRKSTDYGTTLSPAIGSSSDIIFRFSEIGAVVEIDGKLLAGSQRVFSLDQDSVWQVQGAGFGAALVQSFIQENEQLWAFTNNGIYVTRDSAKTWQQIEQDLNVANITGSLSLNDRFVLGTTGGVFISDENKNTTISFSDITTQLSHVTITRFKSYGDELFIFANEINPIKTEDGSDFSPVAESIENRGILDLTVSGNTVIVSTSQGMYRRTNNGEWNLIGGGPPAVAIEADGNTVLANDVNRIEKSEDGGATWKEVTANFQLGSQLPTGFAFLGDTMFVYYAQPNVLGGYARSTDGGETWASSSELGISVPQIVTLNGKVFAARASLFTGGGVSVSEDAGETWTAPETQLNDIIGGVTRLSVGEHTLYAQTSAGFYQSEDEGITWSEVSSKGIDERFGFVGTSIYHNGSLYFGQSTNSLHKLDFTSVSILEDDIAAVTRASLSQNYPNPFNPTTKVTFSLPESADVRITVYNMLGQKVGVMASGKFTAGEHTLSFDGSDLSSGVYLYRIEAAGYTETQKMTLIK
ncbi:MAG: T9SS type A sorting domain-containing protein [Bacteroidota bacterium]